MIRVDSPELDTVRFPRRERTGVLAGRSAWQFAVMVVAFLGVMGCVAFDISRSGGWLLFWFALFALGAWQHRREPLIAIIGHTLLHLWAVLSRQNDYLRPLREEPMKIMLPIGRRHDDVEAPRVRDTLSLPGGLAHFRIVEDPRLGCFVMDTKRGVISIVVAVNSEAWELRDTAGQVTAYDGIVAWLNGLESIHALTEVVARIRVDRAPSTAAREYVEHVDASYPAEHRISERLRAEYDEALESARSRSMAFHNHVTFSFSLAKLRPEIRRRGGGLSGIADFLESVVALIQAGAEGARLQWGGWLDGDEFDELLAASWDPVSTVRRREREGARPDLGVKEVPPPVMAVRRRWNHLRVDGSFHSVYWVAEWPRSEVKPGFLLPVLYQGAGTRVLTLQLRPEPVHKSLTRVQRSLAGLAFAQSLRERFGTPTTAEQEKEEEDVREREGQLADGFVDVGFRGFITVSAPDEESLARARGELEMAAPTSRLAVALLWGRQGQAFFTAALPLGVGAEK